MNFAAGAADAATNLATLNAGYQWIERNPRWSATAYRNYGENAFSIEES